MWWKTPNFNNWIYLQRSPDLENPIANEPNEEEDFPFIVPNKFFFLLKFIYFLFFNKSNSQFRKQKYFYDKSILDQPVRARRNEIKYAEYSAKEIYDLEYMTENQGEKQVFYFIKII
jgi:hypothetical protein